MCAQSRGELTGRLQDWISHPVPENMTVSMNSVTSFVSVPSTWLSFFLKLRSAFKVVTVGGSFP